MPSFKRRYTVTGVLMAVGLVICGAAVAIFVMNATSSAAQFFVAPGSRPIDIDKPGKYAVNYIYSGQYEGKKFITAQSPPAMELSMVRNSDSSEMPESNGMLKMSFQGSKGSGVRFAGYDLDQPGAYTLSVAYPSGTTGGRFLMSIEPAGVLTGALVWFSIGMVAGVIVLAVGGINLIATLIKQYSGNI